MTEAGEAKKKDMKDVAAAVEGMKCHVRRSLTFVDEFLSEPMCGRCLPCSLGSYEARVRLERLVQGCGSEADLLALRRIAAEMLEGSMCKKGKDTAQFLGEALATGEFEEHVGLRCRERECPSMVIYRIIPEKCVMCGLCQDACRHNAITGEKKESFRSGYLPFEIRQKRCVKCGECLKVCQFGAVEVIEENVEAVR